MINFEEFQLDNGLRVIVHEDHTVPIAAVNLLYQVGSRDEDPGKTGFAHLFEHLMFGGSVNIPNYDTPLQQVGGDNNAFTSPDITNYYITLPAFNLETAFWLESDRMLSLSFDEQVLEVQRKVVIEEFKQRYLNQPYGDAWLRIRPIAYQLHPYRWPTIGADISHIEHATMEDVKDFFFKFYRPNNGILVVAGHVTADQVRQLANKWFGEIAPGQVHPRRLPVEPRQQQARFLEVTQQVPVDALYKVYHMAGKMDPRYVPADLLSDVLGRGKSSRFFEDLVNQKKIFSSVSCSITGSVDPGLLVVSGKVNPGIRLEDADAEICQLMETLQREGLRKGELQKVKNQSAATLIFSEVELLARAMGLAFAAMMGNPDLVNQSLHRIEEVTEEQLLAEAREVLRPDNCTTVYYRSQGAS
jgi:predicted Zn-dependent peptidase